jgi:hypothetical protein
VRQLIPDEPPHYLRDRVGLTYSDGSPRHGSSVVVLAQGDVSAPPGKDSFGAYQDLPQRYWPPASLMNDLYAAPATGEVGGGYGWSDRGSTAAASASSGTGRAGCSSPLPTPQGECAATGSHRTISRGRRVVSIDGIGRRRACENYGLVTPNDRRV